MIKESIDVTVEMDEGKMNYFYRMLQGKLGKEQAFGIEVERQDVKNGRVVNIERDSVKVISNNEEKVKNIFNLVYKNNVSPIHLIDVIGEYVDECVNDFN